VKAERYAIIRLDINYNFVFKKTLQLKKCLEDKKQWEDKQKELEREQKRRERQVCSFPYTA
jgi:hypothetical protein